MTRNSGLAIALGIAALFGAAAVQAADLKHANVPFAFEVAGQRLAAGTYNATLSNGGTLLIQGGATNKGVYLIPTPVGLRKSEESIMTFSCYGSSCFLGKIQFGQSEIVYQVRTSKHERELAKLERPEVTLIAMR